MVCPIEANYADYIRFDYRILTRIYIDLVAQEELASLVYLSVSITIGTNMISTGSHVLL